jgi:hypothetical protein
MFVLGIFCVSFCTDLVCAIYSTYPLFLFRLWFFSQTHARLHPDLDCAHVVAVQVLSRLVSIRLGTKPDKGKVTKLARRVILELNVGDLKKIECEMGISVQV